MSVFLKLKIKGENLTRAHYSFSQQLSRLEHSCRVWARKKVLPPIFVNEKERGLQECFAALDRWSPRHGSQSWEWRGFNFLLCIAELSVSFLLFPTMSYLQFYLNTKFSSPVHSVVLVFEISFLSKCSDGKERISRLFHEVFFSENSPSNSIIFISIYFSLWLGFLLSPLHASYKSCKSSGFTFGFSVRVIPVRSWNHNEPAWGFWRLTIKMFFLYLLEVTFPS